jgi:AcrR family transcriptional regulator
MMTLTAQLPSEGESRSNILHAAMGIVRKEGWDALSMRKIADRINCTPPAIYSYFSSKEAIRLDLARWGFLRLGKVIDEARNRSQIAAEQLNRMWVAYVLFAREEKMLYQIMFGQGMVQSEGGQTCHEGDMITQNICDVMRSLPVIWKDDADIVTKKYYMMWAMAHGAAVLGAGDGILFETFLQILIPEWVQSTIEYGS